MKFFFLSLYRIPKPETQIKQAKRVERDLKEAAAAKKARKVVRIQYKPFFLLST